MFQFSSFAVTFSIEQQLFSALLCCVLSALKLVVCRWDWGTWCRVRLKTKISFFMTLVWAGNKKSLKIYKTETMYGFRFLLLIFISLWTSSCSGSGRLYDCMRSDDNFKRSSISFGAQSSSRYKIENYRWWPVSPLCSAVVLLLNQFNDFVFFFFMLLRFHRQWSERYKKILRAIKQLEKMFQLGHRAVTLL